MSRNPAVPRCGGRLTARREMRAICRRRRCANRQRNGATPPFSDRAGRCTFSRARRNAGTSPDCQRLILDKPAANVSDGAVSSSLARNQNRFVRPASRVRRNSRTPRCRAASASATEPPRSQWRKQGRDSDRPPPWPALRARFHRISRRFHPSDTSRAVGGGSRQAHRGAEPGSRPRA